MNLLMWLKRLFCHGKEPKKDWKTHDLEHPIKIKSGELHSIGSDLKTGVIIVTKTGSQATRQDYGKFMKHGHQTPYYRKSIKAKVKPEDED